jgi:acyl transferase domain-containing protein
MNGVQQEPIAIIGMGCRFPGANNPQAFWQLLRQGRDAVREVPANRWDINQLYDPDPTSSGKMVSRWGGFIDNVDQFDWRAFRISPREAKYMDPQHRLLLEVVWEALEDAGLPLEKVAGSRTSVFQGISSNDYLRLQARDWSELDGYTITGNAPTFAANRISYVFDLKGPSVTVNMACAASLAAVHYACQSLWMGEATLAIAGGVNLMLSPDISIMLSKAGLLSPEGRCKTLDTRADGFVRGEGAGVVVLKPLSQLTRSDRVYALIRGTAVNHNGHNEWIMAASPTAQEAAIRDACSRAGVEFSDIDYVELHGTGLPKGDPIETKVLGAVIGTQCDRNRPCIVGSVKTNIGHLEAAAGIASLIKVALSLYHREIPPTLHLQQIHPDIPLEALGLVAQQTLSSWPDKAEPLLAGVTAISMAGVNAHAVLESPPQPTNKLTSAEQLTTGQAQLLPLSSRSPEALAVLAHAFKDFLTAEESDTHLSLQDICYTASVRRSHHEHRLALVAHSRQAFAESLELFLQGQLPAGASSGRTVLNRSPKLVFAFAGLGTQGWSIGRELLKEEHVFRTTLEECDRLFRQHANWSLLADLGTDESRCFHCDQTENAQLALFALQVALAALWRSWGIVPDAVMGDGVGEVAAACVAGTLSLEEAVLSLVSDLESAAKETTNDKKPFLCPAIVEQLVTHSYSAFVELSPHPLLSNSIYERLHQLNLKGTVLASVRHGEEERAVMLESLGTLYALGCTINWNALYPDEGRCIQLPTYPWQRERIWLDWLNVKAVSTAPELASVQRKSRNANGHPLLGKHTTLAQSAGTHLWEVEVGKSLLPYLDHHRIQGLMFLPEAAYLEMVFAMAAEVLGVGSYVLEGMVIHEELVLPEDETQTVQLILIPEDAGEASFQIFSCGEVKHNQHTPWTLHATGKVGKKRAEVMTTAPVCVVSEAMRAQPQQAVSKQKYYEQLWESGLEYGTSFQGIQQLWRGNGEALGHIQLPEALVSGSVTYQLHPALLNACLQVFMVSLPDEGGEATTGDVYSFAGVDSLRFYGSPGDRVWSHLRLRLNDGANETFVADVTLFSETCQVIAEFVGLHFKRAVCAVQQAASPNGVPTTGDGRANRAKRITREAVKSAQPWQRQQLLESYLCEQVALALGRPASELDIQQPLNRLGLDSITALEVKHRVEADFRVAMPMTKLLEGLGIRQIVAQVLLNQLTTVLATASPALALDREVLMPKVTENIQTGVLGNSPDVVINEGWEEYKL